jgi:hypothetical protein
MPRVHKRLGTRVRLTELEAPEKGKAGQDNEQPPEEQDLHACKHTQISAAIQGTLH